MLSIRAFCRHAAFSILLSTSAQNAVADQVWVQQRSELRASPYIRQVPTTARRPFDQPQPARARTQAPRVQPTVQRPGQATVIPQQRDSILDFAVTIEASRLPSVRNGLRTSN